MLEGHSLQQRVVNLIPKQHLRICERVPGELTMLLNTRWNGTAYKYQNLIPQG